MSPDQALNVCQCLEFVFPAAVCRHLVLALQLLFIEQTLFGSHKLPILVVFCRSLQLDDVYV